MQSFKRRISHLRETVDVSEIRSKKAQAELIVNKDKANEADGEVRRLENEYKHLETEIGTSEKNLLEMTSRLTEAEKQAAVGERARRTLEEKGQAEFDRLSRLTAEHDDVDKKNEDVTLQLDQVSREIENLERKLEEKEKQCGEADAHVKQLEAEVLQVGQNVHNLDVVEEKTLEQEEAYNIKLAEMDMRYKEYEEKAAKYEQNAIELEATLKDLDVQMNEEKKAYQRVKDDLDNLLAQIQTM